MLEEYLATVRAQAGEPDQRHVSFEKHAQAAGVSMPGNMCPECGGEMAKTASLWKCDCGMMKRAIEEERVDPGWIEAQQGMELALQRPDRAMSQYGPMMHPAALKSSLKHGLVGSVLGGVGGGVLGHVLGGPAGAGAGTSTGGLLGFAGGLLHGQGAHLRERGVHPKFLGLGGAEFTPEAAEKYLMPKTAAGQVALIARGLPKVAELWQHGVLEQGHAGDGEQLRLLPALGATPPEGGSGREEQLGDRHHEGTDGVESGGLSTGVRDVGVGPGGLTYQLTNAELVKKAAAGMPGRK